MTTQLATIGGLPALQSMEEFKTLAVDMAEAKISVPKHLQGSPADCLAIIAQATAWNMNPFLVAQKTHVVNGALGYESQLIVGVLQSSGHILGPIRYDYSRWPEGASDGLIRAGAILADDPTGEITWGTWLDTKKQTVKNSPLWKSNPQQQASYLAAKQWARLYCPAAILGLYSEDELETRRPMREVNPAPAANGGSVNTQSAALAGMMGGAEDTPGDVIEGTQEAPQAAQEATPQDDPAKRAQIQNFVNTKAMEWAESDATQRAEISAFVAKKLSNRPDMVTEFVEQCRELAGQDPEI